MPETTCECGAWAALPSDDPRRCEWINRARRVSKVLRGRRTFDCRICGSTLTAAGTALPPAADASVRRTLPTQAGVSTPDKEAPS